MNYLLWLMRAKRWAQRPPSGSQVRLVLAIVSACVALAAVEWYFGWPDWLTVNRLSAKP